jgi:hypothetical protein
MTDIVAPTPIADPPPAPLVTDTPAEFNSKAFTLAGWYQTLVTALNALIANVFNNATAAQERATAANTSATTALGYRDQSGAYRDQAQAAAATAVNAPGTSGTSATSLAVTAGTKTLTTQPGKAWVVGQPVVISRTATPTAVQMYGVIASYDSGTGAMTVTVPADGLVGSGTYTDWTIALTGRRGVAATLPARTITTDTVGEPGYCYLINAACKLTLPPLGGVDEEIEFRNISGLTTPTVDFGATKVTTPFGIKTPGLMTLTQPYAGARLRSSGNATLGYIAA